MKNGFRATAVAFVAFCVAGCGGSSTSSGPSFQELGERLVELDNTISTESLTVDMPASGTARYSGQSALLIAERGVIPQGLDDIEIVAVGQVELTADFSNSRISGSMTNFRVENDARLPGTLNVSTGPIVGPFVSQVDVRGTLNIGGATTVFDMTGDGEFRGSAARFFRAQYEGTATDPAGGRVAGGVLVVQDLQE